MTLIPRQQRQLEQALRHHSAGQFEAATRLYRRILAAEPRFANAQTHLGDALTAMGRHADAKQAYLRAVQLQPQLPTAHFNLGCALGHLGELKAAADSYRRSVELDPQFINAHVNLAVSLQRCGLLQEAVEVYRRILALAPGNEQLYNNLGALLREFGYMPDAIKAFRRAIELKADYAEAHHNLGMALLIVGQLQPGEQAVRRAIELKPDYARAYLTLATLLNERREYGLAAAACRQAIELQPELAAGYNGLGIALQESGQAQQALALYEQAAALQAPGFDAPWVNKAFLLFELGQHQQAIEASERALTINPRSGKAWCVRSELKSFTAGDPDLERMQQLLTSAQVNGLRLEERIDLEFALGKAWMDVGDADRAFAHLDAANRLKRATIAYDPQATSDWMQEIASRITPALLRRHSQVGETSELPVFVVGMPRSGTTLVEQMLASHGEMYGAGELSTLQQLAKQLCRGNEHPGAFPQGIAEVSGAQLRSLGNAYVQQLAALAPDRQRVVDKMPINFIYAGLIHMALPNARIIHCQRDPMDTGLSCYTKNFRKELSFAFDLAEIGRFYRSYHALMGHWRALLPADRFMEIRYEELISDPETQARRLVAFCGLSWDERCLSFHTSTRPIRTLSASQVRRPVYRSSIGRWRAYAEQLAPLLAALGDLVPELT